DTLLNRLKADQKTYMRGRTQPDLTVVKSILSDLIYLNKSPTPPATPDEALLNILQRSIKKRQESIAQYQSAGRQDLVDQEKKELDVLVRYMPAQLTDDEIRHEVLKVVQNIGAASIKDLGKVMKAWDIDSSKADKKKVSEMVKIVLEGK
ncbi:Yqey-like protein-domain-containing protein, partial [Umbelopsis sp. PMI_123]